MKKDSWADGMTSRSDFQIICWQTLWFFLLPFLQFHGLVYGEDRSFVLRHRRLWSFRFSVPTDTTMRVWSSHLKPKTFQCVKNALRNEVKYRRIILTGISIYYISFAWLVWLRRRSLSSDFFEKLDDFGTDTRRRVMNHQRVLALSRKFHEENSKQHTNNRPDLVAANNVLRPRT